MTEKTVVLLTGPSCAGKTTLETELKQRGMSAMISTTSRRPRQGEVDGVSYYFKTRDQMIDMARDGLMAEWVEFNGEFYGLSLDEFERAFALGKPVVAVVEPNGRDQLLAFGKQKNWRMITVFINGDPLHRFERFSERIMNDMKNVEYGTSPEECAAQRLKIMTSAANRLSGMTGVEATWADEDFPYDMWIGHYNVINRSSVSDMIAYIAHMAPDSVRRARVPMTGVVRDKSSFFSAKAA